MNNNFFHQLATLRALIIESHPSTLSFQLDSIESESILNYSKSWTAELTESFPTRRFVPLVTDMNGRAVHICRYLTAITPPQLVVDSFRDDPFRGLVGGAILEISRTKCEKFTTLMIRYPSCYIIPSMWSCVCYMLCYTYFVVFSSNWHAESFLWSRLCQILPSFLAFVISGALVM